MGSLMLREFQRRGLEWLKALDPFRWRVVIEVREIQRSEIMDGPKVK